ncbi:TPM domain-containing protein [Nocardia sp. alder85J]|uniref:TPM domain-containing protein n=1 Tax=Nocardia sp. alder85J TaxID=2862949 RepID=UPI001CD7D4C7|nr:TPM domain-containing protein [Nocardia sp. alder85J]MCX4097573.1 TPM domain-containing protein [Nocardia sp. alder85J]
MPQPPVHRLRSLLTVLGILVIVLCLPGAAGAEDPVRLPDYVTDSAQVLDGGQRDRVRSAVDSLYGAHRERLWVSFVHDFAGLEPADWGARTATASGFGPRDVLLSVAVGDHSYAFTGRLPQSVRESELDALLRDRVEPRLRDGQWAEAAVATADGLSAAMAGPATHRVGAAPVLIVAAVAVLGVGGVLLFARRRRTARERAVRAAARAVDPTDTTALAALRPDLLDDRSREILVDTDDALRTSAEELRLAADEFGGTATAPFAAALESAKRALAQAFSIRQRLDDDIPETPDQRRDLLVELISTCARADRELDTKVTEFDAMRNLLIDAPGRLDALTQSLVDLTARLPVSERTLAQLTREQPAAALAPIRDNVAMARERIDFAETSIGAGRTAVARPVGQQGAAVAAIRGAESAVTAARTLLDAVDTAATDIEQARAGLPALLAELRHDIDTATGLSPHGGPDLTTAVTAARAALAAAAADGASNPLGVFHDAVTADTALEHAIAAASDRKLAAEQLQRRLDQAMTAAVTQVRTAADYIGTRRGGVDATPRTRLAEAERALDRARQLASTDPAQALAGAQQAAELAARALRTAQASVREWQARQPVSTSSQTGAVLGGILIDSMLRGGFSGPRGGGPMNPGSWGPGSYGGSDGSRRISRGGRF